MKKVKRIILSWIIVMFAFVTFGFVEAKEYSSVEEILNDLPNTITLSVNDTDLFNKGDMTFYQAINVELEKARKQLAVQKNMTDEVMIGEKNYIWNILWTGDSIREAAFEIYEEDTGDYVSKDVKVQYANESRYNAADEAYVKNAIKGRSFFAWLSLKNKDDASIKKSYASYVTSVINNSSVQTTPICFGYRGFGVLEAMYVETIFGVVRNGVVYQTVIAEVDIYKEVIIPSNTKDTEKAYLDYALPILEKDFKVKIYKSVYKGNAMYEIFYRDADGEDSEYVLIRKNDVTRVMDNVVLSTFEVIPTGTVLSNTSATYKDMNTRMSARGYNTFAAYDLKITSGKLSKKATLTFTVDNKYNGQNVLVILKNGTSYQEVPTTVKNGKVSVSVSNLTPVMIGVAKNVAITGVKINQGNVNVVVNKTTKLTATINPSNTTQSKTLTWTSSNTKVATVDKNGVVKGIKVGTATITVKTSNGKTATVKVTVKKATPIKSVKLNKSSLKLELNKTAIVKATINPSGTTDSKTLTWSSSNKKVAIVDQNGKITAVGGGTAKITVKTSNGKKATVKVTVSKINAKKATITAIKDQQQNGKAIKPSVEVKLNGKVLKNGTDYTVTYKNNKNAGKATVTVKFKGNYTGSVKSTFLIIPSKVTIKNPTTAKKSITVKYSKVPGAKTYQIAYRLKGTDKWSYTTKAKISKLTSGKEYEVMVRAGIKSGSKTLYGAWSVTKTIKVK